MWRQDDRFDVGILLQKISQRQKLSITIDEQMRVILEKTVERIGEVACHLADPSSIGFFCDTGHVNLSRFQVHHHQDVERDHSTQRPDFGGGEVDGGEGVPVGFQERSPGRLPLAVRRRFEAVGF